jgi:tRNA(adenine34) deaminase
MTASARSAPTEMAGATASDEDVMRRALEAARECSFSEDVPVGAVVVRRGVFVSAVGNARERLGDPTAHAEILALREAAVRTGSWRLEGCSLYVTLEPCAMCSSASVLARVDRVVFGASDPKAGFAGSLGNLVQDPRLNHRPELLGGVLAEECAEMLRAFFRERRGDGPVVRP